MFQNIVYSRCGNKNIMISKDIVVAIALSSSTPRSMIKQKELTGETDLTRSKSTSDLNLLFLFLEI